jgi:hypothetical protein
MVEMLMVLLISAILLTVAVVRITRTGAYMAEGERVARTLVADLRFAHSEAITTGKNHYLLFTEGDGGYTFYAAYRVETGGDVAAGPARTVPTGAALVGSAVRAEFTPGGDALSDYTYTATCPGWQYTVTVTLATGAVALDAQAN